MVGKKLHDFGMIRQRRESMDFDNEITRELDYDFIALQYQYQMIKFIDFCEVWFLPESVARVATIVGDNRCHKPRH
ncbi:hypothetical protein TNCV_116531 [Trichonephila clavipes]|nr:hypothetical protein TNCV_116531 [Trichonephila clavipes]